MIEYPFILPIKGYFCKICEVFMSNVAHVEDHLKTKDHDKLYNRYVLINQNCEQNYVIDKAKVMNKILNEKKRKREQEEREEREREDNKRQHEVEQRRRILREKTEGDNRLRVKSQSGTRGSIERDYDLEKGRQERELRVPIIDISDDESVDGSVDSFESEHDEKESISTTVSVKDDKKLSMRPIVDIPKSEWQPCFYKVLKRMIMREVSDATEKAVQIGSHSPDGENLIDYQDSETCSLEEPVINSPSSSSEALSTQVSPTPDLYANGCDKTTLISQEQEDKKSMENSQDSERLKFFIEEDDEEEIEMNSWQIDETNHSSHISIAAGNTSRWSISSQEDSSLNDTIRLEIEQKIVVFPEKSKEENEEKLDTSFSQIDQSQLDQDSYVDFEDLKPTLILDPPLIFGPNQPDLTSSDSTRKNSINDILNFLLTP